MIKNIKLSKTNEKTKRILDIVFAVTGLIFTSWIIVIAFCLSSIDTRKNGLFSQSRVGKNGKPFNILKIRTMKESTEIDTVVTTYNDPRITSLGRFFRKTKIDELPQLINIIKGDMSFVGPRPDISGFADQLQESDRVILTLRPGITGPATLYYRDEEILLAEQNDPEKYNRDIIYPHKIELNKKYIANYSLLNDLHYIFKTIFG